MLLHPYQIALETQIPLGRERAETAPARQVLLLLYGVNDWLGISPCICGSQSGNTVSVLYRNVDILLPDFWDAFAGTIAQINCDWPISAYGTAENQDSVRLTAVEEEDGIRLIQQSISGESTDTMQTLCFQITCPDSQTADRLYRLLDQTDWQTGIAAMGWQNLGFLQEQTLVIMPEIRSHFCYAGIGTEITAQDMLSSLCFSQKILLWTAFLKDGFEPVEFEWLAKAISEKSLHNRTEWELALCETMDRLNFKVINQSRDFEIYDGAGHRRYFSTDLRCPAERVFLKFLFPLNF